MTSLLSKTRKWGQLSIFTQTKINVSICMVKLLSAGDTILFPHKFPRVKQGADSGDRDIGPRLQMQIAASDSQG